MKRIEKNNDKIGYMRVGDFKFPVTDYSVDVTDDVASLSLTVDNCCSLKTCEHCSNLIHVIQNINGQVIHTGFNCTKTDMREDDIKETSRCYLYNEVL